MADCLGAGSFEVPWLLHLEWARAVLLAHRVFGSMTLVVMIAWACAMTPCRPVPTRRIRRTRLLQLRLPRGRRRRRATPQVCRQLLVLLEDEGASRVPKRLHPAAVCAV